MGATDSIAYLVLQAVDLGLLWSAKPAMSDVWMQNQDCQMCPQNKSTNKCSLKTK